jgi:integrase/recombinase XerD
MPSLKAVVRKDVTNSDGKANIKIRLSHDGRVTYLKTTWYILPKYVTSSGSISGRYPGHTKLNGAILSLIQEYNDIIADLRTDVIDMDIYTLRNKLVKKTLLQGDFMQYSLQRIASLRGEGRQALADLYEVTRKHLESFSGSEKLLFREITPVKLEQFESWLRTNRSAKQNTIRNYMCNIRAIFNHAIDNDVIEQNLFPFRKYKVSQERKKPRAIDLTDMKRLLAAQPYLSRAEQRDLDIFLLIFYTGGTNLKDLLYLIHDNHYKDRIIYDRFKTGREYSIRVFPRAKEILDRYPGEKYLLSFIETKQAVTPTGRVAYMHKDILRNINKNLKHTGQQCGISLELTTYVARYSFATIAAKIGIEKDVIAQILGHGLNTMTDLYIDFDQDKTDLAIGKVIDSLY